MPRGNGGPRGVAGFSVTKLYAQAQDDVFNGSALDSKWTQVGSPTPSVGGGAVTLSMASGRQIYQTVTVPTNATLYCRISALNSYHGMFGPFFLDTSGNGVATSHYDSPSNIYNWLISSNAYSSTGNFITQVAPDCWLKLRKAGTSYYTSVASHDSSKTYLTQSYSTESAALTSSASIARIGIGAFFTNSETAVVEEFRYVPS